MPTWDRENYVIFKNFFCRFNKYLLKFTKHCQKVHILWYMYKFFYEKILNNKGNVTLHLERPFFYITYGDQDISSERLI